MNALWQGCCQSCGEAECADTCQRSFKSSYVVTGINGQYNYSLNWPNAEACSCDRIQSQQFHRREYSVQATWAQVGNLVITRSGPSPSGSCCWYGTGQATVTVTLQTIDYRYCCITGVETIVNTQNASRSLTVPMCGSLVCETTTPDQPCTPLADRRMQFNICICGFALDGNHELCSASGADFGCENLVSDEVGLYVHGICYEHAFPLKSPSTLLSTEKKLNGVCFQHAACASYPPLPPNPNTGGCMYQEWNSSTVNGPFAISIVEPFTIGIDEPQPCSRPHSANIVEFSAAHALTACGGTPSLHCTPCWGASFETDCCEAIVSGGPTAPYPLFA